MLLFLIMRLIISLSIMMFISACATHSSVESGSDVPLKSNLPPDNKCSIYEGQICIAPIIDLIPDSTCSQYQGTICISPIVPIIQ